MKKTEMLYKGKAKKFFLTEVEDEFFYKDDSFGGPNIQKVRN